MVTSFTVWWGVCIYGSFVKGTWREGSFAGILEDRWKRSGDGRLFSQGSCWGTWKWAYLPGTLRDEGTVGIHAISSKFLTAFCCYSCKLFLVTYH